MHGIAPRHSFPAELLAYSCFARLWAPQLSYMLRGVVGLVASLCRSARFVVVATMAELFAQRGAAARSFLQGSLLLDLDIPRFFSTFALDL